MARENKWPHGSPQARSIDERVLGAARDKIVRNNSVANDIRLGLPVSIPIGLEEEERTRRRTSPILQFPSGYDSRSEIQRPYIKPPPNKTVCCIPTDPGDGTNRGSPSCSCGPTISHKNSFTGNNSGWGLNWGRSGNSPPSHRHQHPPHHHRHHPSTCNPSSSSSSVLKPQKNVSSAGVIGTFLAGVMTSASGGGGFQDNFKSITGVSSSSSSDPKLRFLSERKPVNDRTSPTPNVNNSSSSTSMCSRTHKHGDSVLIGHHSHQQTFNYDDGCSQPPKTHHQQQHHSEFTSSRDSGSSSPNNPFFESFASPTDMNNAILGNSDRRQKYDRKKDRNGNRATETQQPSITDADYQKNEEPKPHTSNYNCWGELLDFDNVSAVAPAAASKSSSSIIMTDPHLVCRSMGVQPSALSESIQEEIGELSTEPSSSDHQVANKYCTVARVMSSEEEINDPTTEDNGQEDARNRRKGERGGVT